MSAVSGPGDGGPGLGLEAVLSERRRLISLAYRLLGSLAEAEDAVQETYGRWYGLTRLLIQAIRVRDHQQAMSVSPPTPGPEAAP